MLIEPNDSHPWEQLVLPKAIGLLVERGIPREDAGWIAPFLLPLLHLETLQLSCLAGEELAQELARCIDALGQLHQQDAKGDRDVWLLLITAAILGTARVPLWNVMRRRDLDGEELAKKTLAEFRARGFDPNRAVISFADRSHSLLSVSNPHRLMKWLWEQNVLDLKLVVARESFEDGWPIDAERNTATIYHFLRHFRFWERIAGPDLPYALEPWLRASSRDELIEMLPIFTSLCRARVSAALLCQATCTANLVRKLRADGKVEPKHIQFAQIVYGLLSERVLANPDDRLLRNWWWFFALAGWCLTPEGVPHRKELVGSATEYCGRLRPLLRSVANEPAAVREQMAVIDEFTGEGRFVSVDSLAISVLDCFVGWWSATKALLMLFRSAATPIVAPDLSCIRVERLPQSHSRHCSEDDQITRGWQSPWLSIPLQLLSRLATMAHTAGSDDEDLLGLRTKLAEFCLERLKPKTHVRAGQSIADADMTDASRHWRRCYIRAIRDLRCNPGARGHRVLYWSSQHDPCPEVRKDAQQVYNEIRNHVSLQEGRSPKSAVFAATWWLRQAHLLELGITPDQAGALRTRAMEIRQEYFAI